MVIASFHSEDKWSRGDLEPDNLDDEYIPKVYENVSQKIGELQDKANREVESAEAAGVPNVDTVTPILPADTTGEVPQ